MTGIAKTLVVFLVLSNSAVTIMAASGLNEDLGVELAPGISQQADAIIEDMKEGFSPDTGVVESFVLLSVGAGKFFLLLFSAIFAVPTLFLNLGFPEAIVTGFFAPAYILAGVELVNAAANRGQL